MEPSSNIDRRDSPSLPFAKFPHQMTITDWWYQINISGTLIESHS